MANVTRMAGGFVEVVLDGSTNWDWTEIGYDADKVNGISFCNIKFYPSAQDDAVKVRQGALDGPAFFEAKAASAYDQRPEPFNPLPTRRPYIAAADVVSSSSARIVFELA